jgi:hypothetical protein
MFLQLKGEFQVVLEFSPLPRPSSPGEIQKLKEPFQNFAAWGSSFHAFGVKRLLFATYYLTAAKA